MNLHDLNKNFAVARANGLTPNQKNKLAMKVYRNLTNINIH